MEKYLDILPEEIVNKVYLYMMSHPNVDIIEKDWNTMLAWEGFGQTWDEFVWIHLRIYREKTRKKPKHCLIISREIEHYRDLSRGRDKLIDPKEVKFDQWIVPRNKWGMLDDPYSDL